MQHPQEITVSAPMLAATEALAAFAVPNQFPMNEVFIAMSGETAAVTLGKRPPSDRISLKSPTMKRQKRLPSQLSQTEQDLIAANNASTELGQKTCQDSEIEDDSQEEVDDELDDAGLGGDGEDTKLRRERRLLQNRKSAKKCRLKKKAELKNMLGDVSGMASENKKLQDKINEITVMLYQKIEENSVLQRKLEQQHSQNQQLALAQQVAALVGNNQSPLQNASQPQVQGLFQMQSNFNSNQAANNLNSLPNLVAMAQQQQQQQQQSQVSNLLGVLTGLLKNADPPTQAKSTPMSHIPLVSGSPRALASPNLNPLIQILQNKVVVQPTSFQSPAGSTSPKSEATSSRVQLNLNLPKFGQGNQARNQM